MAPFWYFHCLCVTQLSFYSIVRGSVSRFFAFFYESNPSGFLINGLKWFCLKYSFLRRYSWKTWLRAVWYCAELDSAQYYTAQIREIKMSENPKLSHTALSRTPHSVILRRVGLHAVSHCAKSNNLIWFLKTSIFITFRVYVMIFRKYLANISKIENGLPCSDSD